MDALEIYGHAAEAGYDARIKYHRRLRHFDMEVRPSDGLALAVRLKAPVLAEEHLLSAADRCAFLSSLQDPCKGLIFLQPGPGCREEPETPLQRNHSLQQPFH
jgi:hypothetical protein